MTDRGNVASIYCGLSPVQLKVTAAPADYDEADETPLKKVKVSSKKPVKKEEKIKEEFDEDNVGAFILPPSVPQPMRTPEPRRLSTQSTAASPKPAFIVPCSCESLPRGATESLMTSTTMGAMEDGNRIHGDTSSSSQAVILVDANVTKKRLRTN